MDDDAADGDELSRAHGGAAGGGVRTGRSNQRPERARRADVDARPIRGLPLVDGVETPDPQTLTLHWQQAFISADSFFTAGVTGLPSSMWPLPRHLLEQPLRQDPTSFMGLPYWRGDFV